MVVRGQLELNIVHNTGCLKVVHYQQGKITFVTTLYFKSKQTLLNMVQRLEIVPKLLMSLWKS